MIKAIKTLFLITGMNKRAEGFHYVLTDDELITAKLVSFVGSQPKYILLSGEEYKQEQEKLYDKIVSGTLKDAQIGQYSYSRYREIQETRIAQATERHIKEFSRQLANTSITIDYIKELSRKEYPLHTREEFAQEKVQALSSSKESEALDYISSLSTLKEIKELNEINESIDKMYYIEFYSSY